MIVTGIKQRENRSAMPTPPRGVYAMTVSKSSSAAEYANFVGGAYRVFPLEAFSALPLWEHVAGWRGKLIAVCDYEAFYTPEPPVWNEGYPRLVALDQCPTAEGANFLPGQCRHVGVAGRNRIDTERSETMSKKQDKDAKRRAKLKARKNQQMQDQQARLNKYATALMDICAPFAEGYLDDSKGVDVVGRTIIWQLGQIAWNVAVSGGTEVPAQTLEVMHISEDQRRIVDEDLKQMVRAKYEKYPMLQAMIEKVTVVASGGIARAKVELGPTFPPVQVPKFNTAETISGKDIFAIRKRLGMTQVKFGEALGVSAGKVSMWEHEKSTPSEDEVKKIKAL